MTEEFTGEEALVWAGQLSMYDAYMTGNREQSNANIADDVTLWDSEYGPMIFGLDGLDALRDSRPPAAPTTSVASLDTADPVITVYGDIAVLRHILIVNYDDPARPSDWVRNTAVWKKNGDRWQVVHNHEDVFVTPPDAA